MSLRSDIVTRRTYNREKEDGTFETWTETVDRVIGHQRWLWERARGRKLGVHNDVELQELRTLILQRKASLSGRTLWLGGTDIAKRREASQFNCAFLRLETVHDMVDALWLLLQGCGVGGTPVAGTLNGFARPMKILVRRSTRTTKGGNENNVETWDAEEKEWTIRIGDSAEAWAKSVGKLLAGKYPAETLILDFSEIRPSGMRLKGYGWISSGDQSIATAYMAIAQIMCQKAGTHLSYSDIHDIFNWLGTILSSRRSSEIVLHDYDKPGWQNFARFKTDIATHQHRQQSNNSLLFWHKPTKMQLSEIFVMMQEAGGSEPGFINAAAAFLRAPWFAGVNPCAEILLASKSFCNLVELNLMAFLNDPAGLARAAYIIARANYRQSCVNLRDGILQSAWHENNEFLRLCGVGLTGIAGRPDMTPYDFRTLRNIATSGAYGMADELGLPRPKNVTTIKPSGTLSKHMNCTEGAHKPLGRYIFNNVKFSAHDPLIKPLRAAGYEVFVSPNATDTDTLIVKLPQAWDDVPFETLRGFEINTEGAVSQLERYKMLMQNYVDHNCSITVSYDQSEIADIIDWIYTNWDYYVGVSFLPRLDPTKSAKDLGYDYLPQEVVSRETFINYISKLDPGIDLSLDTGRELIDDACATGACPVN